MRKRITADRNQLTFLPECIQDWLPEKHLARFVAEIVEQLDLSSIESQYGNRGGTSYDPKLLLSLIFYAYANGIFSSREIERQTYESVAYRYLSGNSHPDHNTISSFRMRFLSEIQELFTQIVLFCKELGLLKVGKIAIDGTKVQANASKHKAMSYKRASELEEKLREEIDQLLKMAESADSARDDLDIPTELEIREKRLARIAEAKRVMEERANERSKAEIAEYEAKVQARAEKEAATGKKSGGKPPEPPETGPKDKDQYNFTDPESRIMKSGAGDSFVQAYNAQAAVDAESMLIIGNTLSNHPNDKKELEAALDSVVSDVMEQAAVIADNGYYSEANVELCISRGLDPYIATGRTPHYRALDNSPSPAPEHSASTKENMAHKLKTEIGKAIYAVRKSTVEPIFGIIKEVMGFRRFSLRGELKAAGEWGLVCTAYNLKRLFSLTTA